MALLIDRTPIMTGNSTPSPYAVIASTENGGGAGTDAWKAMDRADSQWIATTNIGTYQLNFGSPLWIINGYTIECQTPTRMPKDWTFEGSMDGTTWVTLETRTNQTSWSSAEVRTFEFVSDVIYPRVRWNITANNGDSLLEVDEFHVYGPDLAGGFLLNLT